MRQGDPHRGHSILSPESKGCNLPEKKKQTDLEFSLSVRKTSLRTIDSMLGSESGSQQPRRVSVRSFPCCVKNRGREQGSEWARPCQESRV